MNTNYYNKYLKYRAKYLSLKNKMSGGANCPRIGYSQHRGECWHDALSISLLYSDTLSDHIQTLFDNPEFNASSIVRRDKTTFKEHLMPINIEPENYELYLNLSEDYINSLHERYTNDKLPTIKPSIKLSVVSPTKSWTDVVSSAPLLRRGSVDMSLSCVNSIFDIANINNVNPRIYTDTDHGGTINHDYVAISTLNYFLTSYNTNKYIDISVINLNDLISGYMYNVINKLENLRIKIFNAHAICLNISYKYNIASGHAVAFIICNNKYYFYDNNNIDSAGHKSIEFNWKDEFIKRIDELLNLFETKNIEELLEIIRRISDSNEISYLKNILIDFFYGHADITNELHDREMKIGSIGRAYLKDFIIEDMHILELKDIPIHIDIGEQLQIIYDNKFLTQFYNNKKTVDFIKYYISNVTNDYLFELFRNSVLFNNSILADIIFNYLLNNNPRGINAINSNKQNLLFTLLSFSNNDTTNLKNIDLKKHYIKEMINRNINYTTKNENKMDYLEYIKNNHELNENYYILSIAYFITTKILEKILKDTPTLEKFYSVLNHPFFKNINTNKKELVTKYKIIHNIK